MVARTLDRNRGGAGGFHEGLRLAVERGADLVWLMDDDGLPDPDCLKTLLAHAGDHDFWGPVVVDEDDQDRLVFPIRLPGGTARRAPDGGRPTRPRRDGVIRGRGHPVQRGPGHPRPGASGSAWSARSTSSGATTTSTACGPSRPAPGSPPSPTPGCCHPAVGDLGTPMMFGRTTYNHTPSDLKHYCMARNNLVNLRDYRGWPHALAFVAKTLWFYSFTRRDPARLRLSLEAMRAGLRGDFTGHERFLRCTPAESVAVVIVTFNRADLLARMLDGLAAQTRLPDAVFVVDNASTDHTREVLDRPASTPTCRCT